MAASSLEAARLALERLRLAESAYRGAVVAAVDEHGFAAVARELELSRQAVRQLVVRFRPPLAPPGIVAWPAEAGADGGGFIGESAESEGLAAGSGLVVEPGGVDGSAWFVNDRQGWSVAGPFESESLALERAVLLDAGERQAG